MPEMNGAEFLEQVVQRGLVSEAALTKLRQQVTSARRPVRATIVAKVLVDMGHLTAFQARQVINDADGTGHAASDRQYVDEKGPSAADADAEEELELDEEDAIAAGATATASPSAATVRNDDPTLKAADSASSSSAGSGEPAAADRKAAESDDADEAIASLVSNQRDAEIDELFGEEPTEETKKRALQRLVRPIEGAKRRRPEPRKNPWDSPLMYVGGGLLLLLLIATAVLVVVLRRDTGGDLFEQAETDYKAGSYTQAFHKYGTFLDEHRDHPQASLARVRRALCRLHQVFAGGDATEVLKLAQRLLPEIENEESFVEGRADLADILPEVARLLAEAARTAPETADTQSLYDQANAALSLADNAHYVPSSLRPEFRFDETASLLNQVRRKLDRRHALQETTIQIEPLLASGDAGRAHALRSALLREFPELNDHAAMHAMVASIAASEMDFIRLEKLDWQPQFGSPAYPEGVKAITLTDSSDETVERLRGEIVLAQAQGAVYGVEAASGRVLWRRYVAETPASAPLPVAGSQAHDAVVRDLRTGSLLRLRGETGEPMWSQKIEGKFARPVALDDRLLVAVNSGRLLLVDALEGTAVEQVRLPLPLSVPPAVDRTRGRLYQVADHTNLYALSSDDWRCLEVFHLGHRSGAVRVAPVVYLNHVLVAENRGTDLSALHVLSLDDETGKLKAVQEIPLSGHVVTPPMLFKRFVVVATTHGEVRVYEAGHEPDQPLVDVAWIEPATSEALSRYLLVGREHFWMAGDRLSRFAVHKMDGRLISRPPVAPDEGDLFDHPLQLSGLETPGDTLFHVRRPAGSGQWRLAAIELETGRRVWETVLASRPAGSPTVDRAGGVVSLLSSGGRLYRADRQAISGGLVPSAAARAGNFETAMDLEQQLPLSRGFAYAETPVGDRVLIHDDQQADKPLYWLRFDSPLAAPPVSWRDGLLMCQVDGKVQWVDRDTGSPLAAPFQTELTPETANSVRWQTPAVAGEVPIVCEGGHSIYQLVLQADSTKQLAASDAKRELLTPLVSPLLAAKEHVAAVDAEHQLLFFTLPSFRIARQQPLGGAPFWGPHRIDDALLIAAGEHVHCVDVSGELRWQRGLEHVQLVGRPVLHENRYLLSTAAGRLLWLSREDGSEQKSIDVGQPLGSGPAVLGSGVVVAGHDGTLLLVKPEP